MERVCGNFHTFFNPSLIHSTVSGQNSQLHSSKEQLVWTLTLSNKLSHLYKVFLHFSQFVSIKIPACWHFYVVSWSTSWYYCAAAGWCGWCDSHNGTYSRCRANIYADSGLRCFLGFSCHIHYNPLISEIWIDIENLWNVLGFQIWAAAQCEGLCAFVVLFILHTVCMYLFACFRLHRILLSSRFVLHQDQDDLICTNADSKTGEKEAIRNITK